ncbi:DUF4158 domain-containing protein [Microbispora bryophytorum]|uniref:DUF4158 domain-containing protein n=1 Tax=Microbispora bryophytorum TaxID=1460882 RepID=UPI00371EDA14
MPWEFLTDEQFALQICNVRFIGRFLPDDPLDMPWVVIERLAAQLGVQDVSCVKWYNERKPTASTARPGRGRGRRR